MRSSKRKPRKARFYLVTSSILILALVLGAIYLLNPPSQKPIIFYVNQGNGIVNGSNFRSLVTFATSHGFNTIFFQVYRQGSLLFTSGQLGAFANQSHASSLRIFFALYITNASQRLPNSIYGLGEDGINLDMSTLDPGAQQVFLASLKASYQGKIAVTTTDMTSPLKPDLLVLETYGTTFQSYIRRGIIASVGVFATTSEQDYRAQFQYALQNSDGVMVFDYAGLLKRGY